jgi:hypothetical protein
VHSQETWVGSAMAASSRAVARATCRRIRRRPRAGEGGKAREGRRDLQVVVWHASKGGSGVCYRREGEGPVGLDSGLPKMEMRRSEGVERARRSRAGFFVIGILFFGGGVTRQIAIRPGPGTVRSFLSHCFFVGSLGFTNLKQGPHSKILSFWVVVGKTNVYFLPNVYFLTLIHNKSGSSKPIKLLSFLDSHIVGKAEYHANFVLSYPQLWEDGMR